VIAFAVVNLIVDVSYAWFDPRIRLGQRQEA
jgi:ABC-type dipeptide/oligopeptide/nickel transport system permease component